MVKRNLIFHFSNVSLSVEGDVAYDKIQTILKKKPLT